MVKAAKKQIGIRVPEETAKVLEELAKNSGTSVSAQINMAIAEYLRQQQEQGRIKV